MSLQAPNRSWETKASPRSAAGTGKMPHRRTVDVGQERHLRFLLLLLYFFFWSFDWFPTSTSTSTSSRTTMKKNKKTKHQTHDSATTPLTAALAPKAPGALWMQLWRCKDPERRERQGQAAAMQWARAPLDDFFFEDSREG